jgi:saccharopine dehydrogenase (NAD+, L-lysine-forming)
MAAHLWLRAETKPNERRRALSVKNVQKLLEQGFEITVEESTQSIFPDAFYAKLDVKMTKEGSWTEAPKDAIILGLKELPEDTTPLIHRHIFFAHVYKNQNGWKEFLNRFKTGGGKLYDLEFLVGENGRRIAAFGYWAGFAGAAVGAALWAHHKTNGSLNSYKIKDFYETSEHLVAEINDQIGSVDGAKNALITGMRGRSGTGAKEFFEQVGFNITGWDKEHTSKGGPFSQILNYDIFVNCVLMMSKQAPFIDKQTIAQSKKLNIISDVSCDPTGPFNSLPIYNDCTTFTTPYLDLFNDKESEGQVYLTAIDHLPSMLPKESSEDFSNQLLPYFETLSAETDVWERAVNLFNEKLDQI